MLLTIDIGNTTVLIGVFDGKKLIEHLSLSTDREKTADEYGILLSARINPKKIKGIIISSVVPPLLETFEKISKQYFHLSPLVVGPDIKTGLTIKYDYPQELGADRIVNAVAVHHLYRGPAIIVDFGTATTFCALSEKGEYLGGAIAPGIGISIEALFEKTALLPRIELIKPRRIIGKRTVESMQSGLIYGFAELVDGIVRRMKKELAKGAKVIATGGWASLVAGESKTIDEVNTFLTLEGLRIIREKNRKSGPKGH
ncbi:type III pantothenate kinase [bacterium]|nr:type III pantothenate kinase [bacterium]MCK4326269.1 type III pantothenate kinase [bacterium]MCK4436338.1 type III pantothenate kinase [bacterium]